MSVSFSSDVNGRAAVADAIVFLNTLVPYSVLWVGHVVWLGDTVTVLLILASLSWEPFVGLVSVLGLSTWAGAGDLSFHGVDRASLSENID